MNRFRVLSGLALVVALMALAACGGGESTSGESASAGATATSEPAATGAAETGEQPASSTAGEALDVRVITATATNAGTWDPQNYATYSAVAEEMGWNLEIAEAVPYGEADQVLTRWGNEGVDIVYSTDNGFQENMLAAAEGFPDTLWVTMSDLSTTNDLPNVAAYTIDWCQLGFLQGTAGAYLSDSHKIAAVGSIPILPAVKTHLGAQFGAEQAVPGTTVELEYTGGFEAAKAQELTSAMVEDGADVVLAVTQGSASPQVAARAQDAGSVYIGSYGDETKFAPEATATNVIIDFTEGYKTVAEQRLDGTFAPGIFRKGVADGFIRFEGWQADDEAAETKSVAQVQKLIDGELVIPDECENATG